MINGKNKNCLKPFYITIKVIIFHPDTLRKSKQTWHLCKDCFDSFISNNGSGWYSSYPDKPGIECPVIDFYVPDFKAI